MNSSSGVPRDQTGFRHSLHALVLSLSLPPFLTQQMRGHTRSYSSFNKLTTQTTQNSEFTNLDVASLRTIDHIATAKPAVTNADKLWTQIDVLDDVKQMSDDVRQRGLFFNEKFSQELAEVKLAQNRLLESMWKQHHSNVKLSDHQKDLFQRGAQDENLRQSMIDEFFDDLKQTPVETIYRRQNFEDIHGYIAEINDGLNTVGTLMKAFDENVGNSWE